jgi:hypothetical protein
MDPDRSLLDIVGLGHDLQELLKWRVDVLTGASLHPALRERILAESRPLWKDDRVYLEHIRDAIADIEEYASVDRDVFIAGRRRRQDACRPGSFVKAA